LFTGCQSWSRSIGYPNPGWLERSATYSLTDNGSRTDRAQSRLVGDCNAMATPDRSQDFAFQQLSAHLRTLSPPMQAELLQKIRTNSFGDLDLQHVKFIEHELTILLSQSKYQQDRIGNLSRLFFAPVEGFLVDGTADRSKGEITRNSIKPLWLFISHDLLPVEAKEYSETVRRAARASNEQQCLQTARELQKTFVELMSRMLAASERAEKVRARLVSYMAPSEVLTDVHRIIATLKDALRATADAA
jgi:hypothetical protein